MKSTHVYAIINRMFSEKRAVGESLLSVREQRSQDIICWGVKRTHLVFGRGMVMMATTKKNCLPYLK